MHIADRAGIEHGIVIQPATQRREQVPKIGLGERIAEAVGKREQAAAGLKKLQNGLHVFMREERARIAAPAFPAGVVTARG